MNKLTGAILISCIAGAGCERNEPSPSEWELREAAILTCVDEFKTGLVGLSKDHAELATVEHFKTTHLGFVFVNSQIEPPFHISLSIDDCPLSELEAAPVGYEELPDIPAVVSLQLECEGNPELKTKIQELYEGFKMAIRNELGTREVQQGAPADAKRPRR